MAFSQSFGNALNKGKLFDFCRLAETLRSVWSAGARADRLLLWNASSECIFCGDKAEVRAKIAVIFFRLSAQRLLIFYI